MKRIILKMKLPKDKIPVGMKSYLKKLRRNKRRISPLEDQIRKQRADNRLYETSVFRLLFAAGFVLGLPYPPEVVSPALKRVEPVLRTWSRLAFSTLTAFLLTEFTYCFMWPSIALRYSYLVHCLSGYASMVIFAARRRQILAVVKDLTQLSSDLFAGEVYKKPWVKFQLLMCVACLSSNLTTGTIFFFSTVWDAYYEMIAAYSPLPEDSEFMYYYVWAVQLALLLSYNLGTAFLLLSLLFCANSYRASGQLYTLYAHSLARSVENRPLTTATASRHVRLYKRVVYCTRAVDGAFQVSAFFLYMALMNDFFISLSLVLSNETKYRTLEVNAIIASVGLAALVELFFLTLNGCTVPENNEFLKNALIEVSHSVVKHSPKLLVEVFTILTANIRPLETHVTVLGLYKIKRQFITTVMSAVFSYSVIIYQTGIASDL